MFDERHRRPWLDALNPEQRTAATYAGGPLLILAGAGTGKTTTLCARVAWLLTAGVPAERILLLSFTRRAARELVERARTLAERTAPDARRIVGGTFHSLAHQMVRLYASSLGLGPGFGVLDASDAADVLDYVREEHGHAERRRRFPRAQTIVDIYSRAVAAQTPLAQVLADSYPWCCEHREELGEILRAYGERKRALGVIDLDDLLLYWHALTADEVIGPRLAGAFDHVLVDEYQDVNGLQADIVANLHASCRGLTVVGDDVQAIYGFRAASARYILEFPRRFRGAHTVTLERNYRSTTPILAIANAVSGQDRNGFSKMLWTQQAGGSQPELVFLRDEAEQATEVCERALAAREEGMQLRQQAVLFRTGHDSDLLELELTRRGIPFVKYGGLRYLDAAHVKDLVALMRLADNAADEVSWFRVLQLLEGVGPTRARRILDALRPPDGSPPRIGNWQAAIAHIPGGGDCMSTCLSVTTAGRVAQTMPTVTARRRGFSRVRCRACSRSRTKQDPVWISRRPYRTGTGSRCRSTRCSDDAPRTRHLLVSPEACDAFRVRPASGVADTVAPAPAHRPCVDAWSRRG
jgi:DNA helicase II / ATP-dependent DNA helicase PcrA